MDRPTYFTIKNEHQLQDKIFNLEEIYGVNFFVEYEVKANGKIKGTIIWEEEDDTETIRTGS